MHESDRRVPESSKSLDDLDSRSVLLGRDMQGCLRLVGRDERRGASLSFDRTTSEQRVRFADAASREQVTLNRAKSKSITMLPDIVPQPERVPPECVARRRQQHDFSCYQESTTGLAAKDLDNTELHDAAAAIIQRQQKKQGSKDLVDLMRDESRTRAERRPLIKSSDPEKWKSFVGHRPSGTLQAAHGSQSENEAHIDSDGWLTDE